MIGAAEELAKTVSVSEECRAPGVSRGGERP